MFGHGYFCGYNLSFFHGFMPLIVFVILVFLLYTIFSRNNCQFKNKNQTDSKEALEILKIRYAKGEITKEEFEQIRKDINI